MVLRGILGVKESSWLHRERASEQLISMTTSSGHEGRQKIKRRGGDGKKRGSFTPALSSLGTDYREKVTAVVPGPGPGRGLRGA